MIRNILANSTLLLATTETEKLKEHPVILLPVAIIIHAIGHHCKWLTYKWVPDTLMIGSLVILQIFVG